MLASELVTRAYVREEMRRASPFQSNPVFRGDGAPV